MDSYPSFKLDDQWIRSQRPEKNRADPFKPYAYHTEKEFYSSGRVEDVTTIFLTNRECPFNCLMCDLWKNTTDIKVPVGAIPQQIEFALNNSPKAKHLKLYNSGNFFDQQAIPIDDYPDIALIVSEFETVIVESHPKMITPGILNFRKLLKPELQIALGLETIHPEVLPLLNKRMVISDFEKAIFFLNENKITTRAFILLRPPFLSEKEGISWAKRSIEFAFKLGVECCVVIPTRKGNGAIDWLEKNKFFTSPDIDSLEKVVEFGLDLKLGRVFSDLWDIELFSNCNNCINARKTRLENMNLYQKKLPIVSCSCM